MLINACQIFIDSCWYERSTFPQCLESHLSTNDSTLFCANYHLEHHLYPGVPCYRLYKIHKLLKDRGIYEQVNAHIEPSFFGSYRQVATEYTAGTDSSFHPFKLAIE
jgi:hypothetical protein